MRLRSAGRPDRPPRLALRLALFSGCAVMLAAGAILWGLRENAIARTERDIGTRAQILLRAAQGYGLRAADFARPATGRRRKSLDRVFRPLLDDGVLRIKLYGRDGRATYSTDHSLIGSAPANPELADVLGGKTVTEVTTLNHEGGSGTDVKVLEAYVPAEFLPGRVSGALSLYHDYAPLAAEGTSTITSVALVLGLTLLALYAALFPILRQVTTRLRRQMEVIEHQAFHDSLTSLPNRTLLEDRLEQIVLGAAREPTRFAVMIIDLEHFKEVNDTLGHEPCDRVLHALAERLSARARASDTVARLGGDEVAGLAGGGEEPSSALALA